MQSDRSMKGWGGVLEAQDQSTEHWSAEEQALHTKCSGTNSRLVDISVIL